MGKQQYCSVFITRGVGTFIGRILPLKIARIIFRERLMLVKMRTNRLFQRHQAFQQCQFWERQVVMGIPHAPPWLGLRWCIYHSYFPSHFLCISPSLIPPPQRKNQKFLSPHRMNTPYNSWKGKLASTKLFLL